MANVDTSDSPMTDKVIKSCPESTKNEEATSKRPSFSPFSMAHALSMIRKRQEDIKSKEKDEKDGKKEGKLSDEEKKERARLKRQRRRRNQKLAKAKARDSAAAVDTEDLEDVTGNVAEPAEGGPSGSLKRAADDSLDESAIKLPAKKRYKLLAKSLKTDGNRCPDPAADDEEAIKKSQKLKSLVPRALMLKNKATK